MKKLSFLFVSFLILGACNTTTPTDIDVVEMDSSIMTFVGYSFELPTGWVMGEVSKTDGGHDLVDIKVPDSKYDVSLEMDLVEGPTDQNYDDSKLSQGTSDETGTEVYLNPCGGAFACYAVYLTGEKKSYFLVSFQVKSNEPVPENLDGVWNPKTEVTTQDLVQFLLTAKKM